jgi:hypothetical protein
MASQKDLSYGEVMDTDTDGEEEKEGEKRINLKAKWRGAIPIRLCA